MESYIAACACIIILSSFGCIDGLLDANGVKRRDAAFAAFTMAAFSALRYKPASEFDIDVAVIALPVALMALSVGREHISRRSLAMLGAVAALPIAVQAALSLYEYGRWGYAGFMLRATELGVFQLALCAMYLILAYYSRIAQKAR